LRASIESVALELRSRRKSDLDGPTARLEARAEHVSVLTNALERVLDALRRATVQEPQRTQPRAHVASRVLVKDRWEIVDLDERVTSRPPPRLSSST